MLFIAELIFIWMISKLFSMILTRQKPHCSGLHSLLQHVCFCEFGPAENKPLVQLNFLLPGLPYRVLYQPGIHTLTERGHTSPYIGGDNEIN